MATASFVTYLQRPRELLPVPEFRAPPPSPVTGVLTSSSSGSSGYGEHPDSNEDDEIGRFLRHSARVPVLRLPERAVPRRKKAVWAPPVIDVRLLALPEAGGQVAEALRSAAVAFGCFQVVGHGVDRNLVSAASRHVATRPEEMEVDGGDEDGEEMWWSPGEGDQEMAGKWALKSGASHFSANSRYEPFNFAVSRNTADALFTQLEQTATKIMDALQRGSSVATESIAGADGNGSLLCIRKHRRKHDDHNSGGGGASGTISHDDILRMLVRSSRFSRALALHLCPGASAFHLFSRRGWSRFRPLDGAVVVTVGDQIQAWNGGLYKSVAGKPAYSNDDLRGDGVASVEFFHCFPSAGTAKVFGVNTGKIIPLNLQFMVAACLVLGFHFILSCLHSTW
uniref:Non-haem dioxygenase N-terminal domain-containing protein n=1 Tax=Leersia perrieri TaxID=77586 RepID=A0A0D9V5J3_9ORYZ